MRTPKLTAIPALVALGLSLVLPTPAWAAPPGFQAGVWQVEGSNWGLQLLGLLANPNVAYLLFVLGVLGVLGELLVPGAVYPGLLGAVFVVLSLVGFGQLQTNWGGLALIVLGAAMFFFDLHAPGHGLSVAGVLLFVIGPLLMFTPFWQTSTGAATSVSPWVILGVSLGIGAFFTLGVASGLRAQSALPAVGGMLALVGRSGSVRQELAPEGVVHVEGEEWSAVLVGAATAPVGLAIRVVGVRGLTLEVEIIAPE